MCVCAYGIKRFFLPVYNGFTMLLLVLLILSALDEHNEKRKMKDKRGEEKLELSVYASENETKHRPSIIIIIITIITAYILVTNVSLNSEQIENDHISLLLSSVPIGSFFNLFYFFCGVKIPLVNPL